MDRLLKLTGFGWDDDDKMIKAPEDIWEELIKKDKAIQEYRDKVWLSWIDLQAICASSTASGAGAVSSKGKDGTCTTKSSQIDLNTEVEVHDIDSDEINASPGVFTKKSTTIEPEKKRSPGSGSKGTGSMNISDVPDDELSDSEQVLINNISAVSLFRDVLFTRLFRTPRNTSILTGAQKTIEFLEGCPVRFYEQFRLEKHRFYLLQDALCERKLLKDTNQMTVDEQLLMFLHTIGHNVRNRVIQDRYQHSGEPISRHFNKVLDAINGLRDVCITDSSNQVPSKILGDARFYPYFKNCLREIDGTHIEAKVRLDKQTPYRNRHGYPSQNVMAVVSFDMTFSYVAAGWEGSASDQAVLRWAVTSGGLVVPEGKFYLVDSGYANTPRFIAPYRGDRYHIASFRGSNRRYTSEKDLFNHLHAQLRNVVERTFGVLKARFPILSRKGGIPYPYRTQVKIVMACCIIHNFIRKVNHPDELFEVYEHGETEQNTDHGDQQVNGQAREDDRVAGERLGIPIRYSCLLPPAPPIQADVGAACMAGVEGRQACALT
ncbi:uncharacterized protein [Triticum aestivum]|uniref:uncharacterized protein n=1 Tax=Triticum aestivum TaxID=4565 RepID=UPI001D00D214|nr:uncharacterized protein LOC123153929 [Triticum aestivum]